MKTRPKRIFIGTNPKPHPDYLDKGSRSDFMSEISDIYIHLKTTPSENIKLKVVHQEWDIKDDSVWFLRGVDYSQTEHTSSLHEGEALRLIWK